MKKIFFSVLVLCTLQAQAQTAPNGSGGTNSGSGWWRGGNTQGNGANIMATTWNSPIYFYTDGYAGGSAYQGDRLRMKLNGTFDGTNQYIINGYTTGLNTSGYLGLGNTSNGPGNNLWANKGPFSLLHLNGRIGNTVQEFGYRPWMQTGITLTDNIDLSYIGLRQVGTGTDVTETTITWADNPAGPGVGPDDMAFRFTSGAGNASISTTDLQTSSDLDGLHIARFAGTGEFGLGNTFGINTTGTPANLYARPASLAHYSLSNLRSVWQQFTNRNTASGSGTGEDASDGLRIGIIGNANTNVNGTAAIYNQETRALLFSTNAATNSVNVANGTTLERMRIMSVGTPTHLSSGSFGVYNPGSIATNYTRMAVSHDPSRPVTRPLSLLHLGYNTGLNSTPLGATDGWRSWMDIGTFTTNGTDNMYVGLKNEGTDRFDAVVSWGDNQSAGLSNEGPDNLRFIFTSTTSSVVNPGDPVSQSANGLEVARMHPGQASTLSGNFGMVGIGNFAPNGPNAAPANAVDAKLDIDGDLRIRTVTQDNSLNRVLVIDPDDHNRVHWADIDLPAGGIQANNGTSVSSSDFVVFGQDYQEAGDPAQLLNDREVPMRGKNILFTDEGRIGIGDAFSNPAITPEAKLDIRPSLTDQKGLVVENSADFFGVPFYEMNSLYNTTTSTSETSGMGIYMGGNSVKRSTGLNIENATTTGSCFGIESVARGVGNPNQTNTGGLFGAFGVSTGNTGISVGASDGINVNIAGAFRAGNPTPDGQNGLTNTGVMAYSISGQHSIGIRATASGGTLSNYAAHLTGDVYVNGSVLSTSDQNLKENIQGLTNAKEVLNALNPVSFDYKQNGIYERMNMPQEHQYGLIAQEVELILPTLIKEGHFPAEYDSLGNETAAGINFKTMNYEGLIPIIVKGYQEQNSVIDSLQTVNDSLQGQISNLNDRLSQLENCLSGILPLLCQLSQQSIEQNGAEVQEQLRNIIEVDLNNGTAIVLNQNVPNPFAESTVIAFSIPESVTDAQIIFHDATGALIKTVEIRERGNGQLNVYANDLSSGIYTYSLVADGKIAATRRMMKQ